MSKPLHYDSLNERRLFVLVLLQTATPQYINRSGGNLGGDAIK